jgi:hypothetical protein
VSAAAESYTQLAMLHAEENAKSFAEVRVPAWLEAFATRSWPPHGHLAVKAVFLIAHLKPNGHIASLT